MAVQKALKFTTFFFLGVHRSAIACNPRTIYKPAYKPYR